MSEDQNRDPFPEPSNAAAEAPPESGRDLAAMALEIANASFCWHPELTAADQERVVAAFLGSVGDREVSEREWIDRMRALQHARLLEKRTADRAGVE